ncbi:MAG: hypothetical protein CM15mP74_22600 [Halieaceae bacterium]|nr:MAG: hypothetical protein CM15mP74_22600 [Halieaceae bacterium]
MGRAFFKSTPQIRFGSSLKVGAVEAGRRRQRSNVAKPERSGQKLGPRSQKMAPLKRVIEGGRSASAVGFMPASGPQGLPTSRVINKSVRTRWRPRPFGGVSRQTDCVKRPRALNRKHAPIRTGPPQHERKKPSGQGVVQPQPERSTQALLKPPASPYLGKTRDISVRRFPGPFL